MTPATANAASSIEDVRRKLGDRYAIERELGRGGMGAVYLARDLKLDRPVALKVLPPEMAGDSSLRERFLRETRTAASFSHPNIVPVHSVEDRDGLLAFAMGFVEGESLGERVQRSGPLDVRGIVRVLQDVGYALAYAHGRGVIHRDIKPDNIMIERATGRALLMDFGISRSMTAAVVSDGLTRVGEVVGTPEFMSPEQATGDTLDGRTDIYSLGLVALFALTGAKPITGTSTQEIVTRQLTYTPPAACSLRPDLPASIGAVIDRCVAKQPDVRFATAEELVEAVDAAQVAAPEVPLAIRLFAQDLGTLGLVLMFLIIMSPFLTRGMSTGGNLDALIPVILLSAVALTRVAQSLGASRRLVEDGFSPDEIIKGMQAVAEERSVVRASYRANPVMLARRRRAVRIAAVLAVTGIAMLVLMRLIAVDQGNHHYRVGFLGLGAGLAGLILLGVSFMIAMRSPFRAPPADKIFQRVWLGPFGRAFIRYSARGVSRNASSAATIPSFPAPTPAPKTATPTPNMVTPTPSSGDSASPSRLAELEARLAALERDRR